MKHFFVAFLIFLGIIISYLVLGYFTVNASVYDVNKLEYSSSTVGYAEDLSNYNAIGDTVEFHLSSLSWNPPSVTMFIYKIGEDRLMVVDDQYGIVISGSELQNIDCKQSELGCDWPVVYSLDVSGWESGLYYAYLVDGEWHAPPSEIVIGSNHDERFNYIPFVVKSADPVNKILVQLPANTWHAWNGWNGGTYYYSTPNTTVLSFQRPFKRKFSAIKNDSYPLLKWLYQNGYSFDVAVDLDMEEPTFVDRYKLVIPVGHSEYWTTKMYDSLAQFRDNGGNIIFMTSNTMYWRNRYSPASHRLESYKIAWLGEDPAYAPAASNYDPALVTSYFSPARLPMNQDAVDLRYNDVALLGIHGDEMSGAGGYVFYRTQDADLGWIFSGTGLSDGQRIGEFVGEEEERSKQEPQVGAAGSNEVDRVRVFFRNELPFIDRTNWATLDKCNPNKADFDEDYCVKYAPAPNAPPNLTIIGLGDSSNRQQSPKTRHPLEGATMSIYKSNESCLWGECSTVVHVGSWNWAAMALNPEISHYDIRFATITKNLIDRMSAGEIVSNAPIRRYHLVTFQQGVNGYSGFVDLTISGATSIARGDNLYVQGLGTQYTLLKADISTIPVNAKIVSANLLLYGVMEGWPNATMLVDARRIMSEWDESTISMPIINLDEISLARTKIHSSTEAAGRKTWGKDKWHAFNITPFVQKWHDDATLNQGVVIYNPSNNLRYGFRSSDYVDPAYRPILSIVYIEHSTLPWDMDDDCDVDIADVHYVLRRWGSESGDALYESLADIDSNGVVDILDIQAVAGHRNAICRKDTADSQTGGIGYGKRDIAPKMLDYSKETTLYLPIIYRLSNSSVAPPSSGPPEMHPMPLFQVVALTDGEFSQAMNINSATNVAAFEFVLKFDPDVLEVASVHSGEFLSSSGCRIIPAGPVVDAVQGTIKYGAASFGSCGSFGSGVLAEVNFLPMHLGVSPLVLQQTKLGDPLGQTITHTHYSGQVTIK